MSIFFIALVLLVYFHICYFISLFAKDYSLVDMAWGPGFFIVALLSMIPFEEANGQKIFLSFLVGLWACRLFFYIVLRHRKKEDWRYANWRVQWGSFANIRAYLQIFLLQYAILMILSAPLQFLLKQQQSHWSAFSWIGSFLFFVGFLWEAIADYQMMAFKKRKKSETEILTKGLWHYSRHPNYFGESLLWWGIYLFCLSYEGGWLFVFSPALLTISLLKVSGIALLETKYKDHQTYQDYQESTNAFFPWFPKK